MIKAEVVFSGDIVLVKSLYEIHIGVSACGIYRGHSYVGYSDTLEQTIKYCLEN